jgi:hypothetical protein
MIRLGNDGVCVDCKPVLVQKFREGAAKETPEQIRRGVLIHEILVRSFGLLCFAWAGLHFELVYLELSRGTQFAFLGTFLIAILASLEIGLGIGLMRLRRWARISAGFYSVFSWLAIFLELRIANGVHPAPDSLLLGMRIMFTGALLWLLARWKSDIIFSRGYRRVILETPALGRRIFWFIAVLFVIGGGLGVLSILLS